MNRADKLRDDLASPDDHLEKKDAAQAASLYSIPAEDLSRPPQQTLPPGGISLAKHFIDSRLEGRERYRVPDSVLDIAWGDFLGKNMGKLKLPLSLPSTGARFGLGKWKSRAALVYLAEFDERKKCQFDNAAAKSAIELWYGKGDCADYSAFEDANADYRRERGLDWARRTPVILPTDSDPWLCLERSAKALDLVEGGADVYAPNLSPSGIHYCLWMQDMIAAVERGEPVPSFHHGLACNDPSYVANELDSQSVVTGASWRDGGRQKYASITSDGASQRLIKIATGTNYSNVRPQCPRFIPTGYSPGGMFLYGLTHCPDANMPKDDPVGAMVFLPSVYGLFAKRKKVLSRTYEDRIWRYCCGNPFLAGTYTDRRLPGDPPSLLQLDFSCMAASYWAVNKLLSASGYRFRLVRIPYGGVALRGNPNALLPGDVTYIGLDGQDLGFPATYMPPVYDSWFFSHYAAAAFPSTDPLQCLQKNQGTSFAYFIVNAEEDRKPPLAVLGPGDLPLLLDMILATGDAGEALRWMCQDASYIVRAPEKGQFNILPHKEILDKAQYRALPDLCFDNGQAAEFGPSSLSKLGESPIAVPMTLVRKNMRKTVDELCQDPLGEEGWDDLAANNRTHTYALFPDCGSEEDDEGDSGHVVYMPGQPRR